MPAELIEIVKRFGDRRILVVGDFMLDRYEIGDADRISPEAPVAVLRIVEREHHAGGAGSVATIIAALEAHVECLGLVGSDPEGQQLCDLLSAVGTSVDSLIAVDDRPTIL